MKKIINRLSRIEGQLKGLQKVLIDESHDCEYILTQFKATQSAFESCFSELLNENLMKCLSSKNHDELKKILKLIVQK